ncbi:hypothetical protein ACCY16_17295 [Candidatus Pantoea formicae]|uniref:hypothetical protein n=1 Tax=Candidatus Pantoea formicae TaxID=2608355 RepID=UPI003ED98D13
MAETADLVVHVAEPAGVAAKIFRTNDEAALSELLHEAFYHYSRDPGWFEVILPEGRFYACQLVTIPFLHFLHRRVSCAQIRALSERALKHISPYSGATDPAAWIMINASLLTPLTRPGVNLWQARKLTGSLKKTLYVEANDWNGDISAFQAEEKEPPSIPVKENKVSDRKKRKNSPDPEKVMERVTLGWRVRDICEEQKCSEAYVYKLIKSRMGNSAMDLRWKQWELISAMYHAEPKITVEEIERTFSITRSAVYYAIRKVAGRDGQVITPREKERKLTPEDAAVIKRKLNNGALRKDILSEYSITAETLIKHVGTREDYRNLTGEITAEVIRLRVQGKTLQQTADILGLTVSMVKDAWREKKDSPEINEKRVKYDNRNVLSKRDRDQAVNAVLRDGHTRKQVYTQYGINALTLRRYIREAQQRELRALREKDAGSDSNDES